MVETALAQINLRRLVRSRSGTAPAWVRIAIMVGIGWGLFGLGYVRGRDIGQAELAAYKAAAGAHLPEVTSGLLAVDRNLRDSLRIFDRNQVLESENAAYQRQLAEAAKARADLDVLVRNLKDELRNAADQEARLRRDIGKLTGEGRLFTLTRNRTEPLGEGHTIGLADSISMTRLAVVQDNKDYQLSAGNSIPVDLTDKRCVLTLLSLEWSPPSGTFDWNCDPK